MRIGAYGRPRAALLLGVWLAVAAPPCPARAAPPSKPGAVGPVSGGSFPRRHEEYEALVANGTDRALAQLVAAYRRKELEATERARIVSLVCDGFAAADFLGTLRAWREKDADEDDAWLWYRTLRREIGSDGPKGASAAAIDSKRPALLRAAALRALAAWADPGLPELVAEVARIDLGADPARSILVEALAEALASQGGRVGAPGLRTAFEAILPYLRKGACEPRTRLVVARAFSRLLDAPRTSLDPSIYEALLDRREAPRSPEDDRYAPPRYFGLEATGDRIVYVVDESGSMNTSLTGEEREDLRHAAAGSKGTDDPMAALPWDRIRTRRDAAIEFTKASLRALPESASFCVVLFASGISWVPEAFALTPASKGNVDKAVRALDGPRVGGGTNLHGGVRRAFDAGLGPRKAKFSLGSTLDPARVATGPTTVFLLTDGEACADDWGFDFRGVVATSGPSPSDWKPTAPYQETSSLADDVERLNLFRGCEFHAVGIGEADAGLLDLLAHLGNGHVRRIGPALASALSGIPGVGGFDLSRIARDTLARLKGLGMKIPKALQEAADAEERAEKERGGARGADPAPGAGTPDAAGGAGGPAADGAATPKRAALEKDRWALAGIGSAGERRAAAERLGRAKYGRAVVELAEALVTDPDAALCRACEAALRAISGRGFRPWMPGLPRHEREALRRNWTWWWELHREAIEKAEAERVVAEGGKEPSPGTPAPAMK